MAEGTGGGVLQAQGLRAFALDQDGAISTPDPIPPSSDRDGPSSSSVLYAAGRIFLRYHDMWGSVFGRGVGSSGVFGSEGPRLMQDLTNGLRRITLPRTPLNSPTLSRGALA
jgi:hypothetical protein